MLIEREWKDGKLRCHCCNEYKDISDFGKRWGWKTRDYHDSYCKSCKAKQKRKSESNKSDEIKLKQTLIQRYHGAKQRSTDQGLDFNLTLDYLLLLWEQQKGICAISGIPMTYERYNGRIPTNVSIDRINGSKGYVLDNIQLVCMACNQIKSDWSEEVMYNICKKIVE